MGIRGEDGPEGLKGQAGPLGEAGSSGPPGEKVRGYPISIPVSVFLGTSKLQSSFFFTGQVGCARIARLPRPSGTKGAYEGMLGYSKEWLTGHCRLH